MYNKINWILICALTISLLCLSNVCKGQESRQAQEKKLENRLAKVSSATKLDVHRFMGYEYLLPKYISLPYDASMNTNVRGPLFDIGCLLLLFLPILLLFSIRRNLFRLCIMFFIAAIYCVSSITGYSTSKRIEQSEIPKLVSEELLILNGGNDYISLLKLTLFKITYSIGKPILDVLNNISGKGDVITYPLMLGLCLILSFLFLKEHESLKYRKWYLFFFVLAYAFFWWVLGAGIVYYGMLFIPMGFLLIILLYNRLKATNRIIHIAFIGLTVCSIIGSITFRLANFNPVSYTGGIIHSGSMMYGLGKTDKTEAIDLAYRNFSVVLKKINSDLTTRVYKAGTFFHYFIDSNDTRVLEDNQLDKISRLQQKYIYQGNEEVINAFRRSGYKYLLVDLNLSNVDNSPERTLVKKIKKLDQLLRSPSLRIIGTDRIMENNDGESVYTIYGKRVVHQGTFAAFEII